MVSCLLFLIGVITVFRSRFVERVRPEFNVRNIAIILASLGGFAVISVVVALVFQKLLGFNLPLY